MRQRNFNESFNATDALHTTNPAPTTEEDSTVKALKFDQPSPLVGDTEATNPEKIGPYHIGHQVSHSIRSGVFSSTSLTDGRSVMMKFPNGWGTDNAQAAKREFRALRRLQHPGIVNATQLVNLGSRCALVTERLQRRSLLNLVRGANPVGKVPDLTLLCDVFTKLLESLNHIHSAGWIHGAIHYDHVLFNDRNEPVWIDFSHASQVARPPWAPPTQTLVVNSPFMAPELICSAPTDPAADMFAMGRMLAWLLTGAMPRWFPGEAIRISDHRLQSQLPQNTPPYLFDLCAKLVRMSPVQRPTALMAIEALKNKRHVQYATISSDQPSSTNLDVNADSTESSWRSDTAAAAADAFSKASMGTGCVQILTANKQQANEIYSLYDRAPCNDARLILAGTCDSAEQIPLPGFDSLLDNLAQWFEQLTPALQKHWRQRCYPELHHASNVLGRALGHSNRTNCFPSQVELSRASGDIARLLTDLSQQRTLVLILDQIEQIDAASGQLLYDLAVRTSDLPIIIVATTNSQSELRRNPHAAPLLALQ